MNNQTPDLFSSLEPPESTISPLTKEDLTGDEIDRKLSVLHHKKDSAGPKGIAYYLQRLREAPRLWDMRIFKEYKNSEKTMAFIEYVMNPHNMIDVSSAPANFTLGMLKDNKADYREIYDAMMANQSIAYKYRIAQCWHDAMRCPWYQIFGSKWLTPCHRCNDEKDEKKEAAFQQARRKWEAENGQSLEHLIPNNDEHSSRGNGIV